MAKYQLMQKTENNGVFWFVSVKNKEDKLHKTESRDKKLKLCFAKESPTHSSFKISYVKFLSFIILWCC